MITVYHSTRNAARLLAKELGDTPRQWERKLKEDRAKQKRGGVGIPYETAFGCGRPSYDERHLYRFIFASRRNNLAKLLAAKKKTVSCEAFMRASYERGGELGIVISGDGVSAADTWLTTDQAIHLALQLMMKARYATGRWVDVHTGKVLSDPQEIVVSDTAFNHACGEAPKLGPNNGHAELMQLLHSLGDVGGGGHHGA